MSVLNGSCIAVGRGAHTSPHNNYGVASKQSLFQSSLFNPLTMQYPFALRGNFLRRTRSDHVIVARALGIDQIGQGDAVEEVVQQRIQLLPHGQRAARLLPIAGQRALLQTGHGG